MPTYSAVHTYLLLPPCVSCIGKSPDDRQPTHSLFLTLGDSGAEAASSAAEYRLPNRRFCLVVATPSSTALSTPAWMGLLVTRAPM